MQVMGKLRAPFFRSTKSHACLIIGKATSHSSVGTLDSSFLFLSLSGTSFFSSPSPAALEEIFGEAGGVDGRDGDEVEAAMTPPERAEEEAAVPG